jgi:hypothetical protein
MKLLSALLALSLAGCATSTFSSGRDFPSAHVASIVKGKTTTAELRQLFGEPFYKTVVSESEEKWVYTYSQGKAHAQSVIVATSVKTTGSQKMLDILVKDGIVTNYTFSEGPLPGSVQH